MPELAAVDSNVIARLGYESAFRHATFATVFIPLTPFHLCLD